MAELPKHRQNVSCREVEGEIVILDRAAERVHQLNATASFIWQRCDGEHTAADIARELAGTFEVDAAMVDRDVDDTLQQLASLGLLEKNTDLAPADDSGVV